MKKIHYIKIHNFKVFGDEVKIETDQPTVLIGPNNSGKTTALQALALWNYGLKTWFQQKGRSKGKKISTALNRLNIIQVPVQETRYFWKNTNFRKQNDYILMNIAVGLEFQDNVKECNLEFRYFSPEVIYCYPDEKTSKDKDLLEYASNLKIDLLYPMSGIEIEEPLIQEGRINVLIGKGQTAEVLRNLCYIIIENDKENNTHDWDDVCSWMKRLFQIELQAPVLNKARGSIELRYFLSGHKRKDPPLDIALSGRGQQQMLLLIAYIFSHKNSILMIDEPDAHLEILRQRQVFSVLKELAEQNNDQVIIATHSEVFLDEAVDTNLVMLIDGESSNLASKQNIKNAIKIYGIEHYYKAKICRRILYTEGSTDTEMLKEFAALLKHKSLNIFTERLYNYYLQDVNPESTIEKDIDKAAGNYQNNHRQHFNSLKSVIANIKGIAILDSDAFERKDDIQNDLATIYWKKYELENYFVSPDNILRFARNYYSEINENLFNQVGNVEEKIQILDDIINRNVKQMIFNNDNELWEEYLELKPKSQSAMFFLLSSGKKMSALLENIFNDFSKKANQPILLNKGKYYKIIRHCIPDNIDKEIVEKLDLLYDYLHISE